jgi:hypothetical protein
VADDVLLLADDVLLLADEVQSGSETLTLVERILKKHPDLPVLVVGTTRLEALADRRVEAEQLDRLRGHAAIRTLPIDVLPESHREELVATLLGLQGDLAGRVSARTAGNPLFAGQRTWTPCGALRSRDWWSSSEVITRRPKPHCGQRPRWEGP